MALIAPQALKPTATPAKAGWMKTGSASVQVEAQNKAEIEKRKEEQGKSMRFWMKDGEEARVTFVDGGLVETPYGKVLVPPRYYEHNLMLNGTWGHTFVCPQMTAPDSGEKCPICESSDRPTLVALFTVIDHREFASTKTPGKVYKDTVKLYVAGPGTFEQLNKLAQKTGGLEGSTWDISRSGDKSPRVGSTFFPQGKTEIDKLVKQYTYELTDPKTNVKSVQSKFKTLDYEQEIVFRTGDQLRLMGMGKPTATVSGFGNQQGPAATSYAEQL